MKKFILLLLVGCFLQSCGTYLDAVLSELTIQHWASLGKTVIVNPNGTTSYVDPLGAQVGIETKILEIDKNSGINSGLNVSFQGSNYEDPGDVGAVHLTYLNVPFRYRYNLNNGIYGEIGLQPGLLMGAKYKGDWGTSDAMDDFKKFELGLPVGAGYRFPNGLELGIRATYGLTNIDNIDYANNYEYMGNTDFGDEKIHNLTVLGVICYSFNWFEKK